MKKTLLSFLVVTLCGLGFTKAQSTTSIKASNTINTVYASPAAQEDHNALDVIQRETEELIWTMTPISPLVALIHQKLSQKKEDATNENCSQQKKSKKHKTKETAELQYD